jgi:tRNA(Ile)-lysidine synthase
VRRAFLRAAARRAGAAVIATGHHAEDQLETLLLRLLRGCGLAGLGAMSARRGSWIRPLLLASRSDVEADLRAAGIPWREDSSNAEARYARSRIRHDAVPALLRAMGAGLPPDARATRAFAMRVGGALREVRAARRLVERLARHALEEATEAAADGPRETAGLFLDATVLARSPELVRAAALRLAWRSLRTGVGLTQSHVSALTALTAAGAARKSASLPEGWTARRGPRLIRFLPAEPK